MSKFSVQRASKINYTGLNDPSESGANEWSIRTGGGSEFIGSNYRDKIILSMLDNEFNQPIANDPKSIINGGNGIDSLEIVAPEEMKVRIVNSEDCRSRDLIINGKTINKIMNVEKFVEITLELNLNCLKKDQSNQRISHQRWWWCRLSHRTSSK